jgi:hypothetical protein
LGRPRRSVRQRAPTPDVGFCWGSMRDREGLLSLPRSGERLNPSDAR